jgi:hypothetical protein
MAAARSRAIGLDHRPADVVAAERAEQARKAAAYDDAVSVLEAKLGPSWTIGCPTVAEALAEPHTLRVLLGEPHPGPAPSSANLEGLRERELGDALGFDEYTQPEWDQMLVVTRNLGADDGARLYACEADLAGALGYGLHDPDQRPRWPELLAEVVERRRQLSKAKADLDEALLAVALAGEPPTVIDDTTPVGVLALLDAAIDALIRDDEAHLAESLIDERDGLAFELGGDLRDEDRFTKRRADQLAARLGLDKPRVPNALDAQVESLARLDGSVLLARHHRLAAGTDEIIANPSDSGWSERQHLTMLAAICLALVAKLTADTTGGAS